MASLNQLALIFLILCFCILVGTTLPSRSQSELQKQESQSRDFGRFPIIDLAAPEPTDAVERENRTKRGKRHNVKHAPRIDQLTDSTFLLSDWDLNLPALPVETSAAVVVGRVSKAQAQLSEDKTGIYSEFTIVPETILKNDTKVPLNLDKSIEVLRIGGRVLLPSGKIIVSGVYKQDMPQIGSKYVLFLTHHSLNGGEDDDFYILTGYEISDGKVYPLDKLSPSHPINKYTGLSEAQLLTDLSSALAKFSPP